MSLEDYTTPWIEEVFADLSLIDPAKIESPTGDADDGDVVIGEFPLALRCFYALTVQAVQSRSEVFERAEAKAKETGSIDSETQQALHRAEEYLKAIDCIFEISLYENFAAWNDCGIGVAGGWKVIVPVRSGITEWRTPIWDAHWLVQVKAELSKISNNEILRPFRTKEKGTVIGSIRKEPGMQRLYTLHQWYFSKSLRARADFFDAPRDNNRAESVALARWDAKHECVGLIYWESVVQLIDHPWAKAGLLSVRPNWDVIWMPLVVEKAGEDDESDGANDD